MRPQSRASKNSLHRRERRLARSFRSIVLSVLASPLGATMACSADDGDAAGDASIAESSAGDARGPGEASRDATATTERDAAACEPVMVDAADDAPDGCGTFYLLPCGLPPDAQVSSCLLDLYSCTTFCTPPFLYCPILNCDEAGVVLDAATLVECSSCNGITGRRPLGLCAPRTTRATRATPTGDYFASMAHLESASVRAFRDLERWLVALGAPARLTRAARRAAADERRHARAASRLARRFGGTPARPRVRRVETPSLVALLEDDAVEGCIGETFGALLATWQGEHASDPRVRRTLRRIAIDETRHAALAWEIPAWGAPKLSTPDRRRLRRTFERALTTVAQRPPNRLHETTRRVSGHPPPAEERALLRQLTSLVRTEPPVAS